MTDQSDKQNGDGLLRLADKIGKDIACTRTYSMNERAIIEAALRRAPTRDGAEGEGNRWAHLDNADMTGATFKGELSAPPNPVPDVMREDLHKLQAAINSSSLLLSIEIAGYLRS